MTRYQAVGVMSGTSLDGLDIALAQFQLNNDKWTFEIVQAQTIPYPDDLHAQLENAHLSSASELAMLDIRYGEFIGKEVKKLLEKGSFDADLVCSHGHTVFHDPTKRLTLQIGNGASIYAITGVTTITSFRNLDVALGGQGAPLVPIGDQLLFPDYDYCMNLGGFANISFQKGAERVAYDICPVNIVFNKFAREKGKPFDKGGALGQKGKVNQKLLQCLDDIAYYKLRAPKSLSREWLENEFMPRVASFEIPAEDKTATCYEHAARQIAKSVHTNSSVLVTGGGAYNHFLTSKITARTTATIIIPPNEIVEYKEALVFAFLGVLRHRGEANCLSSVTGARVNNSGGIIYPAL